jgi:hypothetical protein
MVYFKVDYLTHIDMESALQKIFKNISRDCNNHLRLLCFHDPVVYIQVCIVHPGIASVYHLEINDENLFIGTLLNLINLLLHIMNIKIHSLSLSQPRKRNAIEHFIIRSTKERKKITKLCC